MIRHEDAPLEERLCAVTVPDDEKMGAGCELRANLKAATLPASELAAIADLRADILDRAKTCVTVDRNRTYGEPEDNFQRIAWRWSSWLWARGFLSPDVTLETHDVAIMCSDIKDARICVTPEHSDHWMDRAGYSACGYQCVVRAGE